MRSKKTKIREEAPHYGVYARLAPSRIHGIGVFAIRNIKKGTPVFLGDDDEIVWKKKEELKRLPGSIRRLYEDFCIIRSNGSVYGCPRNFNLLTVAWYLNESKKPNVGCNEAYHFRALRNIRSGEELTVDYDTYNDFHKSGRSK